MSAPEDSTAENELRLDPLTREWVTIVAARQDRLIQQEDPAQLRETVTQL